MKNKIFQVHYQYATICDDSLCCFISVSNYDDVFQTFEECWNSIKYNIVTDIPIEMDDKEPISGEELVLKIAGVFKEMGFGEIQIIKLDSVYV